MLRQDPRISTNTITITFTMSTKMKATNIYSYDLNFTLLLTSMVLVCSRACIQKKNAYVICIAGEQKAEKGCKVASKQIIILLFLLPNTPKLC